ncbi:L,D-transpeptidase-like protein [Thiocapsa rosea]|uniref:L,D-transpeptidase-like protein n=2 Tax=Thiocapsa rosea TaxID=69360 RepID=A0A495V9M1_9GAMM|nr:L,D-transpeptidase-like protein [Thiocapsa rosea]
MIIAAVLSMGSAPAPAMSYLPIADPSAPPTHAPSHRAPPGKADRLVVKKAERRLYLMQGDRTLRSYEIALGFQPIGHKTREGDGRTPEGRYLLDRRNDRSRFYKALHISYPSPGDRWRAERRGEPPGGMILIHGQPNGKNRSTRIEDDWTLGCIAVSNREIDEIWSLTVDGTSIEILP